MKPFLRALFAIFIMSAILLTPVIAQSTNEPAQQSSFDQKRLLVQPRNADGTVKAVPFLKDPVLWARVQQQNYYASMKGAISRIRTTAPLATAWTLMLLSFGYGVFHAAGPGHGKAVISAWLLATENELRRGVLVALMSAIIQALTAITIVSILLLVVASVGASARNVTGFLESGSFGLIAVMGLYLMWTALRPNPHKHHHHHDESCNHAHAPEASQVKADWSLTKAFSLSFAVGIRPCTGAIAVLAFANALGLYWAGIASTFAMAAGTFITVSAIAAIAVYSKKLAMKLASKDARWLSWTGFALRLGGGAAIAAFGAVFFLGSLGASNSMM